MNIKKSLGLALKIARSTKGITQEDFSEISSRTYVSTLERGLYSPTLEKVDALSKVIGIHPITLLVLTYLINRSESDPAKLIDEVSSEIKQFLSAY